MAKYVLLSFENDSDADSFMHALAPDNEHFAGDILAVHKAEVVAEFKKPTQFCQCTPEQKRGVMGKTGQKYGWYVCGRCMKPNEGGGQTIPNLREMDQPPWRRIYFVGVRAAYSGKIEPRWKNEDRS